ncbi:MULTISPECIES: TIGR03943 family protein [Nocardiaceae]|uniref:Membrane protein n=1 Tax=Rhodococcoides corynebacterioides TaxID=53972 RepID=A0ABS2KN96_9NOCA|nr:MULTISPECIES: TIGR03943 family protein [Rhodococcus]MBM7413449.1 putative membrane protein [Rhodococcus corynebacterioides]MBP1115912.1 putative membrane protein [Rhodococcus sp. PvP016]
MSRETQNLILAFLGIAVLKTTLDGTFVRYVKPGLGPYLIVSAVIVLALAAIAIVSDIRAGGTHEHDDGHAHSHRMPWLLLAPALVVLFLTPPALGPGSFVQRQAEPPSSAAGGRAFPPLPAEGTPELTMIDVLQRARSDTAGTLDDREIAVRGYAMPRADGGVDLARILIICCAADARTTRLHLVGPNTQPMRGANADQWWIVRGVVVPGTATEDDRWTPDFRVTAVEPTAAPSNTYSY